MKKQGRPSDKPQRVTVTLAAHHAEALRLLADEAGVTISAFCAHVLERYSLQDRQVMASDLLKLLIETEMEKVREAQVGEIRAQMHRLSHLLARTALESIASRTIGEYVLQVELDQEKARKYSERSWKLAVDALKQPTPGVKQSLNELIAGAGELDPGVLLAVRASTDAVSRELKRVEGLQGEVQGLKAQQAELMELGKRQQEQLRTMQQAVLRALQALNQAEQDWLDKPKAVIALPGSKPKRS